MPRVQKSTLTQRRCQKERRGRVTKRKEGHEYLHPHEALDQDDRTNITIVDKNTTVLQRFSPTSQTKMDAINKLMKDGQGDKLKEELFQLAVNDVNTARHGSEGIHLGVWHTRYNDLGWTGQHRDYKPASDKMLDWINSYFEQFIEPMESLLANDFRTAFKQREKAFAVLKKKMPAGHCDLLSPWWTMAAVVKGITTVAHPDASDAEPSILINFGCKVWFQIAGSTVCLHSGDVLVFRAKLHHNTAPIGGTSEQTLARRFAVSLSMRSAIVNLTEQRRLMVTNDVPPKSKVTIRKRKARVPKIAR